MVYRLVDFPSVVSFLLYIFCGAGLALTCQQTSAHTQSGWSGGKEHGGGIRTPYLWGAEDQERKKA